MNFVHHDIQLHFPPIMCRSTLLNFGKLWLNAHEFLYCWLQHADFISISNFIRCRLTTFQTTQAIVLIPHTMLSPWSGFCIPHKLAVCLRVMTLLTSNIPIKLSSSNSSLFSMVNYWPFLERQSRWVWTISYICSTFNLWNSTWRIVSNGTTSITMKPWLEVICIFHFLQSFDILV